MSGLIKLVEPRHFLLKCLYQAMKLSGHVYLCKGYRFLPLSTIFLLDYGIVPRCGIFFIFIFDYSNTKMACF